MRSLAWVIPVLVWSGFVSVLGASGSVGVSTSEAASVHYGVEDMSSILKVSQSHLERAMFVSNTSLSVVDLASGVDALMPVVAVLASFVSKPLKKDSTNLRKAAELQLTFDGSSAFVDLETLVADELRLANSVRNRPIAASAYWTTLFLEFFEKICAGVLERSELRTCALPSV